MEEEKKCGSEKVWFMGIPTVDGCCNLLMYSSQYTGTVTTMILDSDSMSSSNNAHSRTNAGRRREKKCGSEKVWFMGIPTVDGCCNLRMYSSQYTGMVRVNGLPTKWHHMALHKTP